MSSIGSYFKRRLRQRTPSHKPFGLDFVYIPPGALLAKPHYKTEFSPQPTAHDPSTSEAQPTGPADATESDGVSTSPAPTSAAPLRSAIAKNRPRQKLQQGARILLRPNIYRGQGVAVRVEHYDTIGERYLVATHDNASERWYETLEGRGRVQWEWLPAAPPPPPCQPADAVAASSDAAGEATGNVAQRVSVTRSSSNAYHAAAKDGAGNQRKSKLVSPRTVATRRTSSLPSGAHGCTSSTPAAHVCGICWDELDDAACADETGVDAAGAACGGGASEPCAAQRWLHMPCCKNPVHHACISRWRRTHMQPAKISRHPREELLPDTSACVFCRAVVFNQRDKLSSAVRDPACHLPCPKRDSLYPTPPYAAPYLLWTPAHGHLHLRQPWHPHAV